MNNRLSFYLFMLPIFSHPLARGKRWTHGKRWVSVGWYASGIHYGRAVGHADRV